MTRPFILLACLFLLLPEVPMGLLNATLGNLTELVITLAALRAGQYMLVKAAIAGAIVTNTLFLLGASFLVGELKYHSQQFNVAGSRLQGGQLFLASVALMVPSFVGNGTIAPDSDFTQTLSLCLAILLITIYGLGLLFQLKTHREFFNAGEQHEDEDPWPLGPALGTLCGVTVLVALVSEVFVASVHDAALAMGMNDAFVGFVIVALVGGVAQMTSFFRSAKKPDGSQRWHSAGKRDPNRAVRGPGAGTGELYFGAFAHDPLFLAGRGSDDHALHHHRVAAE